MSGLDEAAVDALVRRLENKLRANWVAMLRGLKDETKLAAIEQRIAVNDLGALVDGIEEAIAEFTADVAAGYVFAGQRTARAIDEVVPGTFRFDLADPDAARWMHETAANIARPLVEEQQAVARRAVQLGRARGLTQRQIAEEVQASIGLNLAQVDQVERYRMLLARGDLATALSYKLADGRFDDMLRRAIADGRMLTADRIEKMVARYRENWARYRADTVALSVANNATHAGMTEAVAQAVERSFLNEGDVDKTWVSRMDSQVRDSHYAAHGQTVASWHDFVVGGYRARYPGDPRLPAREVAGCRCVMTVQVRGVNTDRLRRPQRVLRAAPGDRATFRRAA